MKKFVRAAINAGVIVMSIRSVVISVKQYREESKAYAAQREEIQRRTAEVLESIRTRRNRR